MDLKEQLETLKRGTAEIISEEDLTSKLKSGKKLRSNLPQATWLMTWAMQPNMMTNATT